jgi:hypothetical protein
MKRRRRAGNWKSAQGAAVRRCKLESVGSATTIRRLAQGDEAVLERFLVRHADGSMFLRSSSRTFGPSDSDNAAARRAYEALGSRVAGDFALILFAR